MYWWVGVVCMTEFIIVLTSSGSAALAFWCISSCVRNLPAVRSSPVTANSSTIFSSTSFILPPAPRISSSLLCFSWWSHIRITGLQTVLQDYKQFYRITNSLCTVDPPHSDKGHNRNNLKTKDKIQCTKWRLSYSPNIFLTSDIKDNLSTKDKMARKQWVLKVSIIRRFHFKSLQFTNSISHVSLSSGIGARCWNKVVNLIIVIDQYNLPFLEKIYYIHHLK